MEDLFAACGINCGRCPSYKENLRTDEDRQRCSDGWYRFHGFRLSPEKVRRCDGCLVPVEENPVRYFKHGCNVRKCAVFNGAPTCAHCSAYPCQDINRYLVWADEREERAAQLEDSVSEEDYFSFVEAYSSRKHLDEIRASLASKDIVQMKSVSTRPRLVGFPDDLPFSKEDRAAFEDLHRLIGAVEVVDGVSYARQLALKKRRRDLLKMLWAFGRFGEHKEEGDPYLMIDSRTYLAQKIQSSYQQVQDYLKTLGEYGAICEHVPIEEGGWLTPKKALRRGGWFLRMSFDDDAGGVLALNALQTYAAKLDAKHGKSAFRYFSRADMRILATEGQAMLESIGGKQGA